MTFDDILEHAIEMLQRRGRVTYWTLKRQFHLDDEALEDLKFELIEGQHLATDENGTVPVWTGTSESAQDIADAPAQAIHQPASQEPHSPPVAPQPTAPPTPEAERCQLMLLQPGHTSFPLRWNWGLTAKITGCRMQSGGLNG
jgi:hypothetical protein